MDEESVGFSAVFGNLTQGGADVFGLLARIRENDSLFALRRVVDVLVAGVK